MDKGKQPAKEQVAERPQPTGFMADARRISRGPTAPPTHATLSYTKSRNRVREEAVSNFTLKPLGSTVTRPFILRNEVFTELLPHQVEGLEWLWNIHCRGTGGLVADDMGLGKTKQILAFLAGLLESKLMKTALIAVPAAIVHQWIEEMIDLGLENYIHIFKDKQTRKEELAKFCESGGLLITTHTLATNNWSVLKGPWDYMIIDEAHVTCKKETLKSYCNLQRLHCSHRILLTGTPSPNGLKELRAILNFCCPGIFSSVKDFHENYLAPLVEGNYKGSSSEQLNESFKASQKLQGLLSPCFLRRLKNVLSSTDTPEKKRLNLPEKVEFVVWLRLSPYQEKLYRELLSGGIVRKNNPGEMIVASTLMQKICNHPTKLDKISQEDLDGTQRFVLKCMVKKLRSRTSTDDRHFSEEHHSSKLDIIVRLLERFNEQKLRVLIFSRTCEMLDAIEEVIVKKGYVHDRIDGSLSDKQRAKRIEAFKKADGAPIFLISSFSGGTGLDLHIASRAIIVEPFWNPCVDDQSADRIYRVGQKKKCIIYRLISSETIEEIVYKAQVFKLGIFKSATENKDFQRYITEKRNELLKTPPNGYGSSRTLQELEKEPTQTLSEEMSNELNFLKNRDIVGVSIHGALFQGAPSRKPIKSDDSGGSIETNWHLDEKENLRMARQNKIAFHEAEIRNYKSLLAQISKGGRLLPDGGAKLVQTIARNTDALSKLGADTDPKDDT